MIWIVLIGLGVIGLLSIRYWYVPFLQNPNRINLQKFGFKLTTEAHKQRVKDILTAFFNGFNSMLSERQMSSVRARCDSHPPLLRPFAHEGAAMAFGLKTLLKGRRSVQGFEQNMQRLSREYYFMYNIGLGFCAGKVFKFLPSRVRHTASQLTIHYNQLCFDGFGFKIGLFDYLKNPGVLKIFSNFEGYSKHACFQGFGRSLWFLFMDAPEYITETISMQDPSVRGDCYSGLGLAVTFTNMDDLRVAFDFSKEVEQNHLSDYFLGVTIALYARRDMDAAYLRKCLKPLDSWSRSVIHSGLQSCDRNFINVSATETVDYYELWRRHIAEDLKSIITPQSAGTAS
jgi:hypothetical protein